MNFFYEIRDVLLLFSLTISFFNVTYFDTIFLLIILSQYNYAFYITFFFIFVYVINIFIIYNIQ